MLATAPRGGGASSGAFVPMWDRPDSEQGLRVARRPLWTDGTVGATSYDGGVSPWHCEHLLA